MHWGIGLVVLSVLLGFSILSLNYVSAETGVSDFTFKLQTYDSDEGTIFGALTAARWGEPGVYLIDDDAATDQNLWILNPDTDSVIAAYTTYYDGTADEDFDTLISLAIDGDENTDTIVYVGSDNGDIVPLDGAARPTSGFVWPILGTMKVIIEYDVATISNSGVVATLGTGCDEVGAGSLGPTSTEILIWPGYMDVDSNGSLVTIDDNNNIVRLIPNNAGANPGSVVADLIICNASIETSLNSGTLTSSAFGAVEFTSVATLDTVTINGLTYAGADPKTNNTEFDTGTDDDVAATSLVASIISRDGSTLSANTLLSNQVIVTAVAGGTAGNSIGMSESTSGVRIAVDALLEGGVDEKIQGVLGIGVDDSDDSITVGLSNPGGTTNDSLVKFDSSGNQLWSFQFYDSTGFVPSFDTEDYLTIFGLDVGNTIAHPDLQSEIFVVDDYGRIVQFNENGELEGIIEDFDSTLDDGGTGDFFDIPISIDVDSTDPEILVVEANGSDDRVIYFETTNFTSASTWLILDVLDLSTAAPNLQNIFGTGFWGPNDILWPVENSTSLQILAIDPVTHDITQRYDAYYDPDNPFTNPTDLGDTVISFDYIQSIVTMMDNAVVQIESSVPDFHEIGFIGLSSFNSGTATILVVDIDDSVSVGDFSTFDTLFEITTIDATVGLSDATYELLDIFAVGLDSNFNLWIQESGANILRLTESSNWATVDIAIQDIVPSCVSALDCAAQSGNAETITFSTLNVDQSDDSLVLGADTGSPGFSTVLAKFDSNGNQQWGIDAIPVEVQSTGFILFNGVIASDTVTINGLTYTAVATTKSNNTEFSLVGGNDSSAATDLADSINNDARTGITESSIDVSAEVFGAYIELFADSGAAQGDNIGVTENTSDIRISTGGNLSDGSDTDSISGFKNIGINPITGDIYVTDFASSPRIIEFNTLGNFEGVIKGPFDTSAFTCPLCDTADIPVFENSAINGDLFAISADIFPTTTQRILFLATSEGDSGADDDVDGILNANDNCQFVANADQLDTDTDGIGDVCDVDQAGGTCAVDDFDCDFIIDAFDNCPAFYNTDQSDIDFDGIGDECDFGSEFGEGVAEVANPSLVVIDPDGTGSTTVTITRTDSTVLDDELFLFNLSPNLPNCKLSARDIDTHATILGDDDWDNGDEAGFTLGSDGIINVEAFWECGSSGGFSSSAPIGNFVSFFDVFNFGPLHITVTLTTTENIDLTTGGFIVIDTVTTDEFTWVLVKDQTDPKENGVYQASSEAWTRVAILDGVGEDALVANGLTVYAYDGFDEVNEWYTLTTPDPVTIDPVTVNSDELIFAPCDSFCQAPFLQADLWSSILDIFVTISDSSIPIVSLSPTGGEVGDIVAVSGFNLDADTTATFHIFGPGVDADITPTSCSKQGTSSVITDRQTDATGAITCNLTIPAAAATDGVYQIELFVGTDSLFESYNVFSAGAGTYVLNVDPASITLSEPSSDNICTTIANCNVVGETTISYSNLGTFTEDVLVSIENIPFGVAAYTSTDNFAANIALYSTAVTLSSSAEKLDVRFVPDDFADIGFLNAIITAESASTSIFQSQTLDMLIPSPSDFSGIDFGFTDGTQEWFDGMMAMDSTVESPGVVNVNGLISIGGQDCATAGQSSGFASDPVDFFMFNPTTFEQITLIEKGGGITINSNCAFSGQVEIPSGLPVGTYFVDAWTRDSSFDYEVGFFTDLTIIDSNTNFVVTSIEFLDWFAAGSNSVATNITVDVLPGKDLSACSNSATMEIFGLSPGILAAFDGNAYAVFPTINKTIGAGGIDTTSLQFQATDSASSDWFEATIQVKCGTEVASTFIQSGILYDTEYAIIWDDGDTSYSYDGGQVIITPFSSPASTATTTSTVSIDASNFTPGAEIVLQVFAWELSGGSTTTALQSGSPATAIVFDTISTNNGGKTISFPLPSDITSPGQYTIQVSEAGTSSNGKVGFADFEIISTTDVFTIATNPSYLGQIEKPTTGSVSADPITITLKALSGKNPGTIRLELFGVPDGVTATLTDNGNTSNNVAITSTTQSLFLDVPITTGGQKTVKLQYVISADTTSNWGIVDVVASSPTDAFGEKIAYADFEIVGSSTYYSQFNFGFVSATPFSVSPGDTISLTMSGFDASDVANVSLGFDLEGDPFTIAYPSVAASKFSATGTKSIDVTIPKFCTGAGTASTDDKCLAGPGFYPIDVSDTTGTGSGTVTFGFADFEVKATTASLSIDAPDVMPALEPGKTHDATTGGAAELTIKLSALAGVKPGTVDLSIYGLPPGITLDVSTDGGTTWTEKNHVTNNEIASNLAIPAGGTKTIQIDFEVDSSTPTTFFPFYVEAVPDSGDTVGKSIDLSIVPSSASAAIFGVATVSVDPFSAEEKDLITLGMTGFTAGERPRIYVAGVEHCDNTGAKPADAQNNCAGSAGYQELSNDTVFGTNGELTNFVIKVPDLNPDAPGLYDITVEDESGRFGSTLFEVLSATNDFNLNVSPAFIDPVEQGKSSTPISINTSAVSGKNPGTVTLKIFGLPPEINTTIAGNLVSNAVRTDAGTAITLGIGASKTTSLVISPTTSVTPGPYFMTIEASSSNSLQFFDTAIEVLPGGNIDLAAFETISINPQFGEIGDVINVKASGFTPNASVSLKIAGGADLATGTTAFSATGTFSTSVKIPTGINPGLYTVKISDGTKDATEFVEVLASGAGFILSVSPDSLSPVIQGTTTGDVKVKVSSPVGVDAAETTIKVFGLPPDATLLFDGNAGTSKPLDPGVGGTVSTIINIVTATTTPPGFYGLTIEANDGTTFSGLPVGISVSPDLGSGTTFATLTLNPATLSPGEDLSLSGTGFEVGTTFSTINVDVPGTDSDPVQIGDTITVDSNGKWNTLIEVPDGIPDGHYLLSVTAGSRTAEAELDIIPETGKFFDLDLTPDFFSVVQNTAVAVGPTASVIIAGANGFGDAGDDLLLLVSDLPLGVSVQLQTSTGTEIATYKGTLQGNSITKAGGFTAGTHDKLTGGTDILPGKQTTLLAKFGASTNAPLGTYQVFIGAEDDTTFDISGRPITVEIKPTGNPPSLTISPTGGSVLGTATIIGENFAIDTDTIFEFGGKLVSESSFTTAPTTIRSDGLGKFTGYVVVPNLEAGTYSLTASTVAGTVAASTSYQILPDNLTESTFTLQVGPKKILISDGGSTATQTVTVKPVGAFNKEITLSLTGLPTGLTASTANPFTPTPGISSTVSFTLTDDNSTTLGSHTYTVSATGDFTTQTASASAEIQAADDFKFSFGPDEVVVEVGGDPVVVNTKATTVTAGAFLAALSVSSTSVSGVTITPTTIQIDPNDLLGTGTITVTAGATAVPGHYSVTLTASDNNSKGVTKTPTLSIIVVASETFKATNESLDPSSLSNLLPGVIFPKYSDGFNPTYKFTSLTTDSLSNTEILTTKVNSSPSGFSTTFVGAPTGFNPLTFGGPQVYNIGIGDGITELALELCLPIESGTTADSLFFYNPTLDQWETLIVTSNNGSIICGVTDHVSSWAVGGVKALASGALGQGGGSVFAPSFAGKYFDESGKHPLEINGIAYDLPEFKNKVEKQTIQTGESTEFKFTLFENSGGDNVSHFEFLINLTDKLQEYHNSDTYIIYDKTPPIFWSDTNQQQPDYTLTVKDPHGFFENVDFDITSDEFEAVITLDITFAKEMAESNIYLRMWDAERSSRDIILENAIEVFGDEIQSPLSEDVDLIEPTNVENTLNIPEWVKKNAKWWGEGEINDNTFVQGIEFLIQQEIIDLPLAPNVSVSKDDEPLEEEIVEPTEIPPWIKNTAQWWSNGQLNDVEFVTGIKWLVQNEIIVIG